MVKAKARKTAKQKKLVLEAAAWLKDQGFSEEEVTEMAAKYTPERMVKIAEGYMRQDEFDRTMDEGNAELATARTDLQSANTRLNTEMAEWATVQRNGKEDSQKRQRIFEEPARLTPIPRKLTTI